MTQNISPIQPGSIVGGYFRDSGGPEQEKSVDQQIAEGRRYCERHQLQLDDALIFIDRARSGKHTDDRDDFFRMIATLDKKPRPCDGLLFWSSARFARNQLDSQYYKAMLRRQGYTLIFLSGDVPDAGPLTAIFEAAVDWKNEQYLTDMRREIKRGIHWAMEQGAFVGGTPTGFRRVPTTLGMKRNGKPRNISRLEIDEALSPLIRQAFEMRARGCTLMEIHNAVHLFNCRQPEYNYTKLLRNEIYTGRFGAIENYVPAIVSPDLWNQVQAVNHQVREQMGIYHRRRAANESYLLNGLAWCADCQLPMWIHTSRKTLNDREYMYRYYDCQIYRFGPCRLRVRASDVESAVLAQIETDFLTDEAIARRELRRQAKLTRQDSGRSTESETLHAKLVVVEREVNNLVQSAAAAPLSKSLAKSLEQREAEADRLRMAIERLVTVPKPDVDPRTTALEIRQALESREPRRIRRALARVVDHVDVSRAEVIVHYIED